MSNCEHGMLRGGERPFWLTRGSDAGGGKYTGRQDGIESQLVS